MFRRLLLLLTDADLRKKIIQVLLLLVSARLLAHIPIPVLDVQDISSAIDNDAALGLLNTISGGAYGQLSFVMLGVGPFITASIVMQLLGVIVPKIREIQREQGEAGQQKINRWTRYLSVPLAALSGWGILQFLANGNLEGGSPIDLPDVLTSNTITAESIWYWFAVIGSLTAGSVVIMWIGEIITEMKMGNGVSMLILAGIIARLPEQVYDLWESVRENVVDMWEGLIEKPSYLLDWKAYQNFWSESAFWDDARGFFLVLISFVLTLLLVVFINDSVRRILVVYSRRGHKEGKSRTLGNVQADLPIKVNIAGVLPIIFAVSFILFPTILSRFLITSNLEGLTSWAEDVESYLSTEQSFEDPFPADQLNDVSQKTFYTTKASDVEPVEDYDSTVGQDLFGFTFSTFDSDEDVKNVFFKNTFLEFETKSTNFGFLPEFAFVWRGVLAYTFYYFVLIIFFTYFYTSTVAFKTEEVAENLQRSGAYIPGYRPGEETEHYLSYISNRLNVVGSIFLAVIAVLPFIMSSSLDQSQSNFLGVVGGTTLLIMVSVTIETMKQLEAQATSIDYERFTSY